MHKKAILFGSIGTIVETSELQRDAFNKTFDEAGLDWHWDPDEYRGLLDKSGGKQRISEYADMKGIAVDAAALHKRKTDIYNDLMVTQGLQARAGVVDVIDTAKQKGVKLGFVTTTSRQNIAAAFKALGGQADMADFDFIADASMVTNSKPAPDIYHLALKKLDFSADACVVIEDTPVCAQAAQAAGIETVAFPNSYADAGGFAAGTAVVKELHYDQLARVS